MTLQESIDSLNSLAREHDASITTQIQIEFGGVRLSVFWEDATLPREAHLHFGAGLAWDKDDDKDSFQWAWVMDFHRFAAAMEEGLDDEAAGEECRRIVSEWDQLEAYLLGRPYRHAKSAPISA